MICSSLNLFFHVRLLTKADPSSYWRNFRGARQFSYGILGNPTYLGEDHVYGEVIRDPRTCHRRDTWERARALEGSRKP
jgi:hypothetical protein